MKIDIRNLAFLAMIGFAVGSTGYSQYFTDGSTLMELVRNTALFLLGACGLAVTNFSLLIPLFHRAPQSGGEQIFTPQVFENKDFECLVHLRDRVVALGDAEGIAVCGKLNDIIFNLSERQKDKPADATLPKNT